MQAFKMFKALATVGEKVDCSLYWVRISEGKDSKH